MMIKQPLTMMNIGEPLTVLATKAANTSGTSSPAWEQPFTMLAMTLLISSMVCWRILDLAVTAKRDLLYQWH